MNPVLRSLKRTALALAALWAGLLSAGEAGAAYEVCNETSYVTRTALAFDSGEDYTSVGWFTVFPGQCRVLIDKPLTQSNYFIHARTIAGHTGPMRHWAGDQVFCTDAEDFNIQGSGDCEQRGYADTYFEAIETDGSDSWKTTFTEPAGYDREKSAILGVQRLLVDLDLLASASRDGYWGRNTLKALERFRRQFSVQVPDEPGPELFRALVQAVQDKANRQGLELCNRSEDPIWAAVGVPQGRLVNTKGWYEISAGECTKPVLAPLSGTNFFVYGETIDAAEKKLYWRGDVRLCTNDVLFSLLSREGACDEEGLKTEDFIRVDTGGQAQYRFDFDTKDARGAASE